LALSEIGLRLKMGHQIKLWSQSLVSAELKSTAVIRCPPPPPRAALCIMDNGFTHPAYYSILHENADRGMDWPAWTACRPLLERDSHQDVRLNAQGEKNNAAGLWRHKSKIAHYVKQNIENNKKHKLTHRPTV